MGSRPWGYYSYSYKLSSVGIGDIISRLKFLPLMPKEERVFVFEMRTEFFINWHPKHENHMGVAREIIGSERFDTSPITVKSKGNNSFSFRGHFFRRLMDYWMNAAEIETFSNEVAAFAVPLAAELAHLNRIPIVVHFEVCTLQQEGELTQDVVGRAIHPHKLFPLYLLLTQSVVRRRVGPGLKALLFYLEKIRANSKETALSLMPQCNLCLEIPCIGDQITKLPLCGCAFHYHCLVPHLERSNLCPDCESQVYDSSLLKEGHDDFGRFYEL